MAYLKLRDLRDNTLREYESDRVRLGRSSDFELPITGHGAEVVSGSHAQLVFRNGAWWVEDIGGRNGTFVDGTRVAPGTPVPVTKGQVVGLGQKGPRFEVDAVEQAEAAAATLLEGPMATPQEKTLPMDAYAPSGEAEASAPSAPPPPDPGPAAAGPSLALSFVDEKTGKRHQGSGGRIRVGRGRECELRPVESGDTSVSRVHCEVVLRPDGTVVVRDAQSRNGTFLNGTRVMGEQPLTPGDQVQLGEAGPTLNVEELIVSGVEAATEKRRAPPSQPDRSREARGGKPKVPATPPAQGARRSFGGLGRTVFIKEVITETQKKHASRVRWLIWSFVALLVIGVGGVYWYSDRQLDEQRAALAAQQALADSVRQAAVGEYQRLEAELAEARQGSAPAAVVDSLRAALTQAEERTTALEDALQRARAEVNSQLAAGDSLRQAAQGEISRLQGQLASSGGDVPRQLLDSLRAAVTAAEQRAAEIEAGLRAVRGADLAHIAQANQSAVGLVSAFSGADIYDGSGFAVTASGYFITNRHVVSPAGRAADSVFVTMADQRLPAQAEVVSVARSDGPDLAVIKIRSYSGPHVPRVDWTGTRARQGEPAALIGFPAGVAAALDRTRTVRTSMSAGIFSKVTPDLIQFDGFTVGGSSGSPVFNAQGEVVAVHAAGLREAAGLAFTVPVQLVVSLLPGEAKRELGL